MRLQKLGHTWLDVFKVDIEGSEFNVFEQIASNSKRMPFTQLQIEVHQPLAKPAENRATLQLLHTLMRGGMRTMYIEPNIYFAALVCMEFAMININACGDVVAPIE
jgi:hypothetical protein